jgi:PAS domain S-box-containing protein
LTSGPPAFPHHKISVATPHDIDHLYRLLVDAVSDYAIFALDSTGHVLSWNVGAERLKGYTADEIIGRHFSVFYTPEDIANGKPDHALVVAAAEGRFADENWRVRKDGSFFWASVVITALHDPTGALIGFAKVTRDLTERRASEERALTDARRIAATDAANLAKSEFLTTLSHELRTPLNAIGGYTELISLGLRGPVTQTQQQDLERIRLNQQHLLGIITDLLNFSKLEAGRITYTIESVPMHSVIQEVIGMIEPQANAKGVALENIPCPTNVVGRGDRIKIEQILLNLISNAIKFTDVDGRITISCGQTSNRVILMVRDTGIGIPQDKLSTIFEPFVQLGRSLTTTREGIGLGLAISRDLARAMDGDITVDSIVGEGSVFTLVLPSVRPRNK